VLYSLHFLDRFISRLIVPELQKLVINHVINREKFLAISKIFVV